MRKAYAKCSAQCLAHSKNIISSMHVLCISVISIMCTHHPLSFSPSATIYHLYYTYHLSSISLYHLYHISVNYLLATYFYHIYQYLFICLSSIISAIYINLSSTYHPSLYHHPYHYISLRCMNSYQR